MSRDWTLRLDGAPPSSRCEERADPSAMPRDDKHKQRRSGLRRGDGWESRLAVGRRGAKKEQIPRLRLVMTRPEGCRATPGLKPLIVSGRIHRAEARCFHR